jgi:cobalt-zinc-cadmium efflux system outer membrane protein
MISPKIIYILIFIFTNGFSLNLFSQSSDPTLILDQLIQEMLQQNPELQASYNQWQVTAAQAPQAGALPDPVLGIGVMNLPVNSFAFNQEMMTGKQISLMQMFPFPGKQGARKDILLSEASIAEQQYIQKKNELIKDLKESYFELFYIDKAIASNQKNNGLLNQLAQTAETRYRVGKGLQQDVLKAQLELSKLTDDLIDLQQQRESLEAHINFLVNRNQSNPLPKTEELKFEPLAKELPELQTLAEKSNPILLSWQTIIQQSNQKVKLAKKEYLPDFSVELAYTQREELQNGEGGVDLVSGMVNLTLPLYFWNKQKKQVQESQLAGQASSKMQESVTRMIFQQMEKTYAELQKNHQRLQLFESSILPQANQTLQSSLAAYQVDKLEFLTVIDNQLRLYEFELESYRILSDYHKNLAELDALVGTEIGRPPMGN